MVEGRVSEVKTGVDELIKLVKTKDRISIDDAARELKFPIEVIQSWVDFLVEEKIIGIEFKFTKPYIYFNKEMPSKEKVTKEEKEQLTLGSFKEKFTKKALEKKLPPEKIQELWQNHMSLLLDSKKEYFFREAKKANLDNAKKLWDDYQKKIEQSI